MSLVYAPSMPSMALSYGTGMTASGNQIEKLISGWQSDGVGALLGKKPLEEHLVHVDMFGADPKQAVKRALAEGMAFPYAVAIETAPDPVSKAVLTGIADLEAKWSEYFKNGMWCLSSILTCHHLLSRRLVNACPERVWKAVKLKPLPFLRKRSLLTLQQLFAAHLLINFYEQLGIVYDKGANCEALIWNDTYLCATSATLSLHLLNSVGVSGFKTLVLPSHVVLELGGVYFDNGRAFYPPGYFDLPKKITGEHYQRCKEKPLESWGVLSSVFYNRAIALFNNGDLAQSRDLLLRALEIYPEDSEAYFLLGRISYLTSDYNEAMFYLDKAIQLRGNHSEAHFWLGRLYIKNNNTEMAEWHFLKAIESNESNHGAYYELGNVYMEQGEFAKAESHYKKAMLYKPNFYEVCYGMGYLSLIQGKYNKATRYFRKALDTKPGDVGASDALQQALLMRRGLLGLTC